MTIARFYDPAKNPEGGALPGVPLDDLTDEQFDALPDWLKASVDASPMYRKSAPAREPSKPATKTDKATGDNP